MNTENTERSVYQTVTLNIAYGSITITPDGYRQGSAAETAYTGDYVITGTSTANTITVTGGTEKAINVTLQDMTTVGINVSGKVNLIISGENKVNGSILFNDGALGISGNGTLTCIAGGYNVAIGSANSTNLTGSITIGGNVTVNATAAKGAAAIGSGYSAGMAESSSITIKDNAVVNAYAIDDSTAGSGAAIGVGRTGRGLAAEMNGTITIQDNASVTATGSGRGGGAAIGAAVNFNAGSKISKLGGTINILGGVVKATGGGAAAAAGNAAAPAIGVGAGGVMTGTVNIEGGIVELIPGNGCKYAIGTPAGEAGTINRSGGILKEGGDWTLLGDNETLRTNWTPANGQMLIINVGQTLTIAKGVTLTIPEGFAVENNGVVMVIGSLIGEVGGDVRYADVQDSITEKEILTAVIASVADCVPEAECYKGRLEEGFAVPAFLFNITFLGGTRANFFTERRSIEIQIIYFGKEDGYGREDFDERLTVQEKLMRLFSRHCIAVGNRVLSFTHEMKEADSRLAVYLTFRYLEESIDQRYMDAENAESVRNVSMRMKVTADE